MLLEIQAYTAKITPEEVLASLPTDVREKVRGKNVAVYCIGEEGTSRPREVGRAGNLSLRWPRAVIRRLAEAAGSGVKLFERHGKDNSHDGRKPLGEIVGSFTRMVGDKLQAIAVALMPEPREDLDVCSIEADVEASGDLVGDVAKVSGLALSSSRVDSPAFAGAQRLATLQCFEPGDDPDGIIKPGKPGEGEPTMPTFQEVQEFIRSHNVFPRQLFTLEDIKQDRDFGPALIAGETAQKRVTELETENGNIKKQSADAVRATEVAAAKGRFEKLIPDGSERFGGKKATDQQKAFYLKRFDPSKLEKLDDAALNAYIEAEAKEYAEYAKLCGVEGPAQKPTTSAGSGGAAGDDPVEAALKETIGGQV